MPREGGWNGNDCKQEESIQYMNLKDKQSLTFSTSDTADFSQHNLRQNLIKFFYRKAFDPYARTHSH